MHRVALLPLFVCASPSKDPRIFLLQQHIAISSLDLSIFMLGFENFMRRMYLKLTVSYLGGKSYPREIHKEWVEKYLGILLSEEKNEDEDFSMVNFLNTNSKCTKKLLNSVHVMFKWQYIVLAMKWVCVTTH